MQFDLPRFLAVPVDELELLQHLAALRPKQLRPLAGQFSGVVEQLVPGLQVRLVPFGPFAGLHPVLVLDLHDRPGGDQLLQKLRHLLAEFGAALGQIGDEQIGQGVGVGTNPGVQGLVVVRELADQKDQRAELVAEFAVVFLLLLGDGLGDFLKQRPRLESRTLDRGVVDERTADDVAERPFGGLLHGVVDDPQLVAELSPGPGLVDGPQHALPEPPPHGKDRIVLNEQAAVPAGEGDLGAGELPFDLAAVVVEQFLQPGFRRGLLLEDDLAGDLLNVGVLQLDRDGKAPLEPLKEGRAGQCVLAGADEQEVGPQPRAALLLDILHRLGTACVIVDVLLDFIEDDHRVRQFSLSTDRLHDPVDHVVDRNVLGVGRELAFQHDCDIGRFGCELRAMSEDRLRHQFADVQVGKLFLETFLRRR